MIKTSIFCLMFLALTSYLPAPFYEAAQKDCPSYFHKGLNKIVYKSGDTMPEFAGGVYAYMRFINKNLRIPQEIIDDGSASVPMVQMKCIVDQDGTLKCITLNSKKDTASFDPIEKEAYRLLRLMPNWEPGICKGKKVPMELNRVMLSCVILDREGSLL